MKVSVLMAAYNSNLDMLRETIYSILNQSFTDFELIIVDDGSKEPLEPSIRQMTADSRIVVYRKENTGLGSSLTYGIIRARGEYIARIDDDDVSVNDRLEKQVAFLNEHPEISCVGGHIYYRYENKLFAHPRFPLSHEQIIKGLASMHFTMAHTCLMYRKESVMKIGCYRIPRGNEDLDLLLQLGTVGKLANIDEYFTYYRLSKTGLSVTSPQKAEAYIFALESAMHYEGYAPFYSEMKESIEELKRGGRKSILNMLGLSERNTLILITKFFGKRIVN